MSSGKLSPTSVDKIPASLDDDPAAWKRFESAVDSVMKAGPQHRKPTEKAKPVAEGHQSGRGLESGRP